MSPVPTYRPGHLGLCVGDLARSTTFYCDGLGFVTDGRHHLEGRIAEVGRPVSMTIQFLRRDGLRLELMAFAAPPATGRPSTSRNRLGLTHLSFAVDQVDEAAAHLVAHGGTVIGGTRSGSDDPDAIQIVFVGDPDGTRIELVARHGPLAGHRAEPTISGFADAGTSTAGTGRWERLPGTGG